MISSFFGKICQDNKIGGKDNWRSTSIVCRRRYHPRNAFTTLSQVYGRSSGNNLNYRNKNYVNEYYAQTPSNAEIQKNYSEPKPVKQDTSSAQNN